MRSASLNYYSVIVSSTSSTYKNDVLYFEFLIALRRWLSDFFYSASNLYFLGDVNDSSLNLVSYSYVSKWTKLYPSLGKAASNGIVLLKISVYHYLVSNTFYANDNANNAKTSIFIMYIFLIKK